MFNGKFKIQKPFEKPLNLETFKKVSTVFLTLVTQKSFLTYFIQKSSF